MYASAICTLVKCLHKWYNIVKGGEYMTKYTEARKNGNRKWDAANLDRISIALPKGSKETIKEHADSRGESVNGFINRAINETIKRDKEEK